MSIISIILANSGGLGPAVIEQLPQVGKINGQSNAEGLAPRSSLYSGSLAAITPSLTRQFQRVFIWNPTAHQFQKLQVGLPAGYGLTLAAGSGGGNELGLQGASHDNNYEDGFGPEIGFAQRWEQENPTGNFYIIKYAVGGTGIEQWLKAGTLWTTMQSQFSAAIAALGGPYNLVFQLWNQGENDSIQMDPAWYGTRLTQFVGDIYADMLQSSTLFVLTRCRIGSGVQAAEDAYVSSHAGARLIPTTGYTALPIDGLHLDAVTMLKNGNDCYNAAYGTTGNINGL